MQFYAIEKKKYIIKKSSYKFIIMKKMYTTCAQEFHEKKIVSIVKSLIVVKRKLSTALSLVSAQ